MITPAQWLRDRAQRRENERKLNEASVIEAAKRAEQEAKRAEQEARAYYQTQWPEISAALAERGITMIDTRIGGFGLETSTRYAIGHNNKTLVITLHRKGAVHIKPLT